MYYITQHPVEFKSEAPYYLFIHQKLMGIFFNKCFSKWDRGGNLIKPLAANQNQPVLFIIFLIGVRDVVALTSFY